MDAYYCRHSDTFLTSFSNVLEFTLFLYTYKMYNVYAMYIVYFIILNIVSVEDRRCVLRSSTFLIFIHTYNIFKGIEINGQRTIIRAI